MFYSRLCLKIETGKLGTRSLNLRLHIHVDCSIGFESRIGGKFPFRQFSEQNSKTNPVACFLKRAQLVTTNLSSITEILEEGFN